MKGKDFMKFLIVVFSVNLAVNLYIFLRTKAIFPSGAAGWWILTVLFWIVAFAYFAGRIAEHRGMDLLASPLVKTGSWWIGAMVYLTLLFLLVDFFRTLNWMFNFSDIFRFSWSSAKGKTAVTVVYALSALILAAGYLSAKIPAIKRVSIQLTKTVPGGSQKVVLVSDLHLGLMTSKRMINKMVKLINHENADLVLIAGDIFDEDPGPVIKNNLGDNLKNLNARHGVFAVLGNHEFFGDAEVAQKYMKDHNITVLRDSVALLSNGIAVAGREDITARRINGGPRKSLDELLSDTDESKPLFLMDHQPFKLAETAEHNVDLQVSGHTHNGQMWPFNYLIRRMFEISRGYGKIKNTHFYVSSGYGTWGPPIRTNSRSEIVVLEVTGK